LFWLGLARGAKPLLVLSFRADGPYWPDLVHLLAYPTGISYIWPFRYDAPRVQADLRKELESAHACRSLAGKPVLIAARFHTASADDRLLPIRYGTLSHVDLSAGIYSFHFRLGLPIQFDKATDLQSCTVQTSQHVDLLAFRERVTPPVPIAQGEHLIGTCWKSFAQLVVRETHLPLKDEAKRSLFINISAPVGKRKTVPVRQISHGFSGPDVHGYALKEGSRYEVKYSHYVPILEGANTTVQEITVEPSLAAGNFEVNTAKATLIGNYGTQGLIVGAVNPTAVWHEFAIAPAEKKLLSQSGGIEINTQRMRIPISVSWSLGHWIWRTFFPTVVLFFALTLLGIANMIDRNLEKILSGTLKWSQVIDNWILVAIVIVGSGLASLAIPILQARTKPK
jgi:hypothetical protein